MDEVTLYNGAYTGAQIDAGIGRALSSAQLQSISANVEQSTTASRAYAIGDYFVLATNGGLYRATSAISIGDTLANNVNCVRTYADNVGRCELLWSNNAPTSDFAAQTIQVANMGNYSAIIVAYRMHNSVTTLDSIILPVSDGSVYGLMRPYWEGATAAILIYRTMTIVVTGSPGVDFGKGYKRGMSATSSTNDNGYVVPVAIYGIKS